MLDPARGKPSRRPRSPSLNHNVKERRLRRKIASGSDRTPPARHGPAGGVGGVYRRAPIACQTPYSRFICFFSALCRASVDGYFAPHQDDSCRKEIAQPVVAAYGFLSTSIGACRTANPGLAGCRKAEANKLSRRRKSKHRCGSGPYAAISR